MTPYAHRFSGTVSFGLCPFQPETGSGLSSDGIIRRPIPGLQHHRSNVPAVADEDRRIFGMSRSDAIRAAVLAGILVAIGIGLAIGWTVHTPPTSAARSPDQNTVAVQHFFENSRRSTELTGFGATASAFGAAHGPSECAGTCLGGPYGGPVGGENYHFLVQIRNGRVNAYDQALPFGTSEQQAMILADGLFPAGSLFRVAATVPPSPEDGGCVVVNVTSGQLDRIMGRRYLVDHFILTTIDDQRGDFNPMNVSAVDAEQGPTPQHDPCMPAIWSSASHH